LENVIQRALLCCEEERIELGHLPEEIRALKLPALPTERRETPVDDARQVVPLRELERREILKALEVTDGNVTTAARLLGLGRATLYRRLGELRLLPELSLEHEPSAQDGHVPPSARPAARVRRRINGRAAEELTAAGRVAVGGRAGVAPSKPPAQGT
jgi:hypothetical protein